MRTTQRRHFRTVWSKRSAREPIPEAVVSVYFTMVPKQPRGYRITYVIEKQRYVHSVDDALQFQPAWLERVLEAKVAAVGKPRVTRGCHCAAADCAPPHR
eukprot:TRINITY_DN5705_c0_g1_i1.p2 TRINITY_DN5705_c0_g1~~TRINITY_DN5705_c0_g1_i1.p2  ORF type:complete len:100 (+),score=24.38 TRINITY_DN5705_c0_g1_i1:501-800(+)